MKNLYQFGAATYDKKAKAYLFFMNVMAGDLEH